MFRELLDRINEADQPIEEIEKELNTSQGKLLVNVQVQRKDGKVSQFEVVRAMDFDTREPVGIDPDLRKEINSKLQSAVEGGTLTDATDEEPVEPRDPTARRIRILGLTDTDPSKTFLRADQNGFIVRSNQVSDERVMHAVIAAIAQAIRNGELKDFEYPKGSGAMIGGKTGLAIKLAKDNISSLLVSKSY